MLQPNFEHLLDKGALVLFFLIVLWIVYKYLNIRFEAMKQDIEREIKAKRIRGTFYFNDLVFCFLLWSRLQQWLLCGIFFNLFFLT